MLEQARDTGLCQMFSKQILNCTVYIVCTLSVFIISLSFLTLVLGGQRHVELLN